MNTVPVTVSQKPLIGSDPEFFVSNHSYKPISAKGLTKGTKENPVPLTDSCHIQLDGVLLELNTKPTDSSSIFYKQFIGAIRQISNDLSERNYILCMQKDVHTFSDLELSAMSPEEKNLGCDPDFNAYTVKPNPKPKLPNAGFRCAGGHIHIGWDHIEPLTLEDQLRVAKMCDLTLGLWGVLNGDSLLRKQLYGKAGCIRFKSYGIEYRSLGNFWLVDYNLITQVFDLATAAYLNKSRLEELHALIPPNQVRGMINSCDMVKCYTAWIQVKKILGLDTCTP